MSRQNAARVEVPNNPSDKLGYLMESWGDRLTLENPRFSERYYKGEMHLVARFRHGQSGEFVASIQREGCGGVRLEDERFLIRSKPPLVDPESTLVHRDITLRHSASRISGGHRQQKVMLVHDVRLMQTQQDFALSSAIWFDSLDSFNRVSPESLYYSLSSGFVFLGSLELCGEVNGIIADRKMEIPERPVSSGCDGHTVVTNMIKRTPEIVNDVPDNRGNFIGNGEGTLDIPDSLSRLRVILGCNWVSFGGELRPNFLEVLDVMFGPFDFGS